MGSESNIDDEISTVFSRKMIVKINIYFVIEIYTIGNVKKKKKTKIAKRKLICLLE